MLRRTAGPGRAGLTGRRSLCLALTGHRAGSWPAELQAEVIAGFPRLDLAGEFLRCFAGQASRKPGSAAAASLRAALVGRLAERPG